MEAAALGVLFGCLGAVLFLGAGSSAELVATSDSAHKYNQLPILTKPNKPVKIKSHCFEPDALLHAL